MKKIILPLLLIVCFFAINSEVSAAREDNLIHGLNYALVDDGDPSSDYPNLSFLYPLDSRLTDDDDGTGMHMSTGFANFLFKLDSVSDVKSVRAVGTQSEVSLYSSNGTLLQTINTGDGKYHDVNLQGVLFVKFRLTGTVYDMYVSATTAPLPTPEPTPEPTPTPTPVPTPEPTPTPPPPLTVSYQPNKTAIVVNITGGQAPYTVSWSHDGEQLGSITTSNSSYRIEGLLSNTNYVVSVIDANSDVVVDVVNTGNFEGFIPPSFPSPGDIFQKMIDNFGVAGSIAIAVIGAAVALGILVILGLWGWRLAKKWLNAAK